MPTLNPFGLKQWVSENRHLLKPPVGNAQLFKELSPDFIVMIVGGPNARKDFHVNPTEEFFYQIEGDITLRLMENGKERHIPIKEGEIFLLPAHTPHSPQRPAGTVGMVIERRRPEGEHDHLRYYCEKCGNVLFDPDFYLTDIVKQLKPLMEQFWADEKLRTCKTCGTVMQPPVAAK